jgi:hypothetical protein
MPQIQNTLEKFYDKQDGNMIGNIGQTGKYVTVTGGSGSNYVNNSNYMSVGQLQYNTNNQRLEMYNGTSWQPLNLGQYYVGLTPDAELLLDWVSKRRDEEAEARRLAEQYPAVADALGAVREAEEQLKTVVALCRT